MDQRQDIKNQQQMPTQPQQPMQPLQPMGAPMMTPPQMPQRGGRNNGGWRARLLSWNTSRPLTLQQERTLPNWIVGSSIAVFLVAMLACWIVFGYVPETALWVTSAISVVIFFYIGDTIARNCARDNEKLFLKYVFLTGLVLRLLWVFYGYFFFNVDHYGYVYGDDADTGWYMRYSKDLSKWIAGDSRYTLSQIIDINASDIDDVGYPMWLGLVSLLTGGGSDVVIPFIIKCLLGAYCAICIYHVAKRHYGEGTARMAAIFVCLNPHMIYWCGTMLKETEMVFLCCLCVDLVDKTLTSGKNFSFKSLLPGMLAAIALFFFRAALGVVIFLAILAHIVMASNRVMSFGKKIIAGLLVAITLLVGMGDRLRTQTQRIVHTVQSNAQQVNMEWRARREGGNEFAKYASAAVFAPLIFTIPFPTFNVSNAAQILQLQLSGGNYIKNIFSFFVLIVFLLMLLSGEWRRHVFVLAYTCGYLACLVLSSFAQSSRFHMPIIPMLMLFAAYGIQMAKTNPRMKKWFQIVLIAEVVACLAWNWFKLKGRGMI